MFLHYIVVLLTIFSFRNITIFLMMADNIDVICLDDSDDEDPPPPAKPKVFIPERVTIQREY